MQLPAKLTQLLPIQTGSGKNAEWKKQDIIVETDYPHNKNIVWNEIPLVPRKNVLWK